MNVDANFCEYCGSSFKEQPFQYNENKTHGNETLLKEAREEPIPFLHWLGTYGLFFIPIVGWIIGLVMLFVWAFQKEGSISRKNWARATLIFLLAYFILAIYLLSDMLGDFMSDPMFRQILEGNYI
jgi:hypothetical protein